MFDVPVDGLYGWVGVSIVSVAVLGVVLGLPGQSAPDARHVASVVDGVATSPAGATATVSVTAQRMKLGPRRIGLATAHGRAHGTFLARAVVPVQGDQRLRKILAGRPPERVFATAAQFRTAVSAARERALEWRPAPDRLRARHVVWGDLDVVLVG